MSKPILMAYLIYFFSFSFFFSLLPLHQHGKSLVNLQTTPLVEREVRVSLKKQDTGKPFSHRAVEECRNQETMWTGTKRPSIPMIQERERESTGNMYRSQS